MVLWSRMGKTCRNFSALPAEDALNLNCVNLATASHGREWLLFCQGRELLNLPSTPHTNPPATSSSPNTSTILHHMGLS